MKQTNNQQVQFNLSWMCATELGGMTKTESKVDLRAFQKFHEPYP